MTAPDRRLNAYRPDLADERLRGRVDAAHYVTGRPARIMAHFADLKRTPRPDSAIDSQILFGDDVLVFEEREGWSWVQAVRDGYVGYVAASSIAQSATQPTHWVSAPRTFLYPGPDMKLPRTGYRSLGSLVEVVGAAQTRGTDYAVLASGEAMVASHIRPIGEIAADFVAVAETLIHTPYLWGGATAFGIDCSGLVQLSMRVAGRTVLRDTDMQAGTVGATLDAGADFQNLRRGDLVFWKGHVGIMADADTLIHANGHTMMVSHESLRAAVDRIGYLYGGPTVFRRP